MATSVADMPHAGKPRGWIGVDLDGTLARYGSWRGAEHIGEPVPAMVGRVKVWLEQGYEVRVLTARVAYNSDPCGFARTAIHKWCLEHIGVMLPVTNEKDYDMIELWDDRAVQVIPNTGQPVAGSCSRV